MTLSGVLRWPAVFRPQGPETYKA